MKLTNEQAAIINIVNTSKHTANGILPAYMLDAQGEETTALDMCDKGLLVLHRNSANLICGYSIPATASHLRPCIMKLTFFSPQSETGNITQLDTPMFGGYVAPAYKLAETYIMFAELLASGDGYLIFAAENAADYAKPCPSASADLARLTGINWSGKNAHCGPILIIEA